MEAPTLAGDGERSTRLVRSVAALGVAANLAVFALLAAFVVAAVVVVGGRQPTGGDSTPGGGGLPATAMNETLSNADTQQPTVWVVVVVADEARAEQTRASLDIAVALRLGGDVRVVVVAVPDEEAYRMLMDRLLGDQRMCPAAACEPVVAMDLRGF